MKGYRKFRRGNYIPKEKRELLWELDRWTIEELEKIGIRVLKVEDSHQHRYTKVVLERDGKRLEAVVENPRVFYERMMPTPLVLTIASLLLHSLYATPLRKVKEGFEVIWSGNYPKLSGLGHFDGVLDRLEELFDFFEGIRDRIVDMNAEMVNSDKFYKYTKG